MPNSVTVELPDLSRRAASSTVGDEIAGGSPLRGITILAVEDSRFASEALRLMCRRLGLRLRRAETILAARSHLKLYRPNVVIVDLGLPDGRGEALIREIVAKGATAPLVLGTSGDPTGQASALAAGANGFLDKPLESFAAFHALLLRHLPDQILPHQPSQAPEADRPLAPDALALRDDFARAAALIEAGVDPGTEAETQAYLAGFLTGVARHAHDPDLVEAAQNAASLPTADRYDRLRRLLNNRLAAPPHAFGGNATSSSKVQVIDEPTAW